MSKISLSPNALGSGTLTIAAPDTNTDRTLTLPDAAGTVALTSQIPAAPTIASTGEAQAGTNNTNFLTPLRLREGFNATGSAPVFACRAFVNFAGSGTVAIRASGNVSSITDNGTGDYTVNLTTAMPDANYAAVAVGTEAQTRVNETSGTTTTSFQIRCLNLSNGGSDSFTVSAAILR